MPLSKGSVGHRPYKQQPSRETKHQYSWCRLNPNTPVLNVVRRDDKGNSRGPGKKVNIQPCDELQVRVKLVPIDVMISIEWMVISRVLRWTKWSRTFSGMGLWGYRNRRKRDKIPWESGFASGTSELELSRVRSSFPTPRQRTNDKGRVGQVTASES
jgi:hypothetical protein